MTADQFFVGALLANLSSLQHHDVIGISHCAQTMGDNYSCPALHKTVELFHYQVLVIGIKRVCGLIHKDELRILIDGASYKDTLFLAHA